jgi:hypothetical protein
MSHSFQPGDAVIWWKGAGGGYVWPIKVTVVAVTPRRITITADDPDERGEGIVTRHVSPDRLAPQEAPPARRSRARAPARTGRPQPHSSSPDSFEGRYPHIAAWVRHGWIEIGHDDCNRPFLRAMSIGGVVWEGDDRYASLDDALNALDAGIAAWERDNS